MANNDGYPTVVTVYWHSEDRVRFMRETTKRYKAAGFPKPEYDYTYQPVPAGYNQAAAAVNTTKPVTTLKAVDNSQPASTTALVKDEDDDNDLHSNSESLLASFQPRKDRRSTALALATPSASVSPMITKAITSDVANSESEGDIIEAGSNEKQRPKGAIYNDSDAAAIKEQWASEVRESESSSADGPLRKRQRLSSRELSTAPPPPKPIHSIMQKKSLPTAIVSKAPNTHIPQQPAWYSAMGNSNGRGNYSVIIDNLFGELKSAIKNCEAAAEKGQLLPEASLKKIANNIHRAFFAKFDNDKDAKMALRKNRLLHNDTGLPRLFSTKWLSDKGFKLDTPGYTYPFHIVADAKELYTKWWMESFDTDLYRGILTGNSKNVKLNRLATSNRLDANYTGRIEGKFHGNEHLLNGQWWPHQICTLRDGAHNSAQGGIAGSINEGAWSVIVAGGHYNDVDKGDVIDYCGTEGTATNLTDATQYLLKNVENGQPVRVIRSERCKNPIYAPAKGYRYDGLYKVVSAKMLKPEKSHYIFELVREEGQDPIRYQGDECRPTPEEIAEFHKAQIEKEFVVPSSAEQQGKGKKKA